MFGRVEVGRPGDFLDSAGPRSGDHVHTTPAPPCSLHNKVRSSLLAPPARLLACFPPPRSSPLWTRTRWVARAAGRLDAPLHPRQPLLGPFHAAALVRDLWRAGAELDRWDAPPAPGAPGASGAPGARCLVQVGHLEPPHLPPVPPNIEGWWSRTKGEADSAGRSFKLYACPLFCTFSAF